jgi:hypothetical protein
MALYIKFESANTGVATINVNGLDAKSIVTVDGLDLIGNELLAGGIYLLIYNGLKFQLISL